MPETLNPHQRHYKIITSHERSKDLYALLTSYEQVYNSLNGAVLKPIGGIVLDSSAIKASRGIQDLANRLGFSYVHTPGKSIGGKIEEFLSSDKVNMLTGHKNIYIDLCTDQDPTFYSAAQNTTEQNTGLPAIESVPTLGWMVNQPSHNDERLDSARPLILLRSQGSCSTIQRCTKKIEAVNTATIRSMLPNPNHFWGCLRLDVFLIRMKLYSCVMQSLKPGQEKIIECFLNIFHSFAAQSARPGALRLRACDDRASLRAMGSDTTSMRRSFASIFQELRDNQREAYGHCLAALREAIVDLAAISGSILPPPPDKTAGPEYYEFISLQLLDRLVQCTVAAYGRALEYDLHFEMYIYGHFGNQYLDYGWPVERIMAGGGHPGIYTFWKNNPILITQKTIAQVLSVVSPSLILADNLRLEILKKIPLSYWTEVQKAAEVI
jgi:hypothetical protein